MENEIMNYEDIECMADVVETGEKTGIGTGVAMLIGAGFTLAVGAGVKLAKKGIAAYKAKKAARNADNANVIDAEENEEDTSN